MSKTICVVGNFSGRNAGDAAILGGLLKEVSKRFPTARFLVPTIKPEFVRRHYAKYNVEPVGLMPWHLSIKIFGWPILRSIYKSDIVLVTDAILFDKKLFNPLFNYLSTLALVLPWAKARGKPVLLYNVNLGPIRTRAGRWCMRRVLASADEIIIRDRESYNALPEGFPRERIQEGADCALNIDASSLERTNEIIANEGIAPNNAPFMTMTINSYLGSFLEGPQRNISKDRFLEIVANATNIVLKKLPVMLTLVVTQVMDLSINTELMSRVDQRDRVRLISNIDYTYNDLAGVFSRAELHVGARTHSLILASKMLTPVVGILVTPKNRGYMESIEQHARMVDLDDMESTLLAKIMSTWEQRTEIRQELADIVPAQAAKARASAQCLDKYMHS
ncbi:MAG TPA: polysaccharide pyruvyl transferase family protein [Woeseiaceae bacterium]|nr:polysaccharide pyruvyl transferase family protein [Woeseiaceae bacterium]